MSEFIKLVREKNNVVNDKTGVIVGRIENNGVKFIQHLEGKIYYDEELIEYLDFQKSLISKP